ncbi:MAG: triose-phosphate isomerase [Alphaproteobacteria bacterium]
MRAGLEPHEHERILGAAHKAAERDLGVAVARRWDFGATTVSASLAIASAAGIAVFATGGIGGVHRGSEVTGDVSAEMLAEAGCRYVIVGHSERRTLHGEDDAAVRAKAEAAHRAGLVAVVCVGESLAEREAGRTAEVLARQVDGSVPAGSGAGDTLVAYEPVWAIGTGRVATPAQVAEAHAGIRARLGARLSGGAGISLLYGGSVKPDNAAELLALADVDGALVGGASLDAAQFLAIVAASPG